MINFYVFLIFLSNFSSLFLAMKLLLIFTQASYSIIHCCITKKTFLNLFSNDEVKYLSSHSPHIRIGICCLLNLLHSHNL